MTQETKQSLLVTRDGQLDDSYYTEVWAEKRREAIQNAAHDVLRLALHAPVVVGKAALWVFTHDLPKQPVQ